MSDKRRGTLTPAQASMVHRLVQDCGWTFHIELRVGSFDIQLRRPDGEQADSRVARELIRAGMAKIVRDQLLPTLEANRFCLESPT